MRTESELSRCTFFSLDRDEWKSVIDDAYNAEQSATLYRRAFAKIVAWQGRDSGIPAALIGLKELLIAKLYQCDHRSRMHATNEEIYFYQNNLAMALIRQASLSKSTKKTVSFKSKIAFFFLKGL